MTTTRKFGRLPEPDENDLRFPMKALLPARVTRDRYYWWDDGAWLDQGNTGTCVGHGWAHWVEDSPVRPAGTIDPYEVYREACLLDVWPGNDLGDLNYGTSVRAGVKALQARGLVQEYRWAWDLETLVNSVLMFGPAVIGVNWYSTMYLPVSGVVTVGGVIEGGHCLVVNGVNRSLRQFRLKNSWGRSWGINGRARISFDDMERLIAEDGEICIPTQVAA